MTNSPARPLARPYRGDSLPPPDARFLARRLLRRRPADYAAKQGPALAAACRLSGRTILRRIRTATEGAAP